MVTRSRAGQPTVSVIIPTCNRAHLIRDSIASALAQSAPPAEIIVVDDGSVDDTAQVVGSFGEDYVTYLRQENAGKSAALNHGIAASSGEALLVLDDDDLLPPDALASHLAALARSPSAGFSFGRFARFSGPSERAFESDDLEPLPSLSEKPLLVQLMMCCFLPHPSWMVRRDVQLGAGRYRTDLPRGQDYEMILRLAAENRGAYTGKVTLFQRKHVAPRKTGAGEVVAKDTVAGWIMAEEDIFREIDERLSDREFRPFHGEWTGPLAQRLAVLQRAVIMFLRKAHDRSEHHFADMSPCWEIRNRSRPNWLWPAICSGRGMGSARSSAVLTTRRRLPSCACRFPCAGPWRSNCRGGCVNCSATGGSSRRLACSSGGAGRLAGLR